MSAAKENLRTTIQFRRIARGESALDVTTAESKSISRPEEQLSKQDEERRRIRRERNKLAANKCRRKKREKIESLEQTASDLLESNKLLEKDIASMKEELKGLASFLEKHECKFNNN